MTLEAKLPAGKRHILDEGQHGLARLFVRQVKQPHRQLKQELEDPIA
jgi:hypothetical protein